MRVEHAGAGCDDDRVMSALCPGHRREATTGGGGDYYSGYEQTSYDYDPSYYYNYYQGRSLQDSFLPRMGSLLNRSV